ncbi:MAG: DUF4040 domain-containing protein [Candidatus Diapherotrites archaeon]|nr:DUF4040 domain-containing protein [Candidatus Diapherotrites archaeon]
MIFEIVQLLLLCGIVASASLAVRSRDLLASVVFLGAMSLLLATEYYLLQAPDVAIAEAGVGAALTTAIFSIALNRIGRFEESAGGKPAQKMGAAK